jgi:hypothetical protein
MTTGPSPPAKIGFDIVVVASGIIHLPSQSSWYLSVNVVVQFSEEEELKALGILLRHSPGTILPNRTYILEAAALQALREAGISFRQIQPQLNLPVVEDLSIGERI